MILFFCQSPKKEATVNSRSQREGRKAESGDPLTDRSIIRAVFVYYENVNYLFSCCLFSGKRLVLLH